ncbi:hypothetical protein MP228_010989 [Amoeboaphelidium protococcarum]|nr:hypothetical protein MP228_010989 [Amoeboaphelidium protococcarum]
MMDLFEKGSVFDQVQKELPDGYAIRPLRSDDFGKGYMKLLSQLTVVGDVSQQRFDETFKYMAQRNNEYHVVVIEELSTKSIVASGSCMVEQKFIRECGKVAHIEDVVVSDTMRGKNFGRRLIDQLTAIGKAAGCYKAILCCDEKNEGFYAKCGYKKKEIEMVVYY